MILSERWIEKNLFYVSNTRNPTLKSRLTGFSAEAVLLSVLSIPLRGGLASMLLIF